MRLDSRRTQVSVTLPEDHLTFEITSETLRVPTHGLTSASFGGPTPKYGCYVPRRRVSLGAPNDVVPTVIRLSPAHSQRRVAPRTMSRASRRHASLDRVAQMPRHPFVAMPSPRTHATRRQDRGLAGTALPRSRSFSFIAGCPSRRRREPLRRSLQDDPPTPAHGSGPRSSLQGYN
jgi:hypothetical protein